MTAVAERIAAKCDDCGRNDVLRSPRTNSVVYCGECKRRHREFAARNVGHTTTEAELALCVSEQRLHIEEAAALMSMAVLRQDWFLIDCALDELQGVDRLADVRRHTRAGVA